MRDLAAARDAAPAGHGALAAEVTPLILTYNEERNIERVLDRLGWARRIVVVDSGSTDRTREILDAHPRAAVFERAFDDYAVQWNFGLARVRSGWTLALDADYVLSDAFIAEAARTVADPAADGYYASFRYCIGGRPLRGTLYPPRLLLFRTRRARYVADGHRQRLELDGTVGRLRGRIDHDDRKPLSRWLEAQRLYAELEAAKLSGASMRALGMTDRLRRLRLAPLIVPPYCLFGKGLILDGRRGWFYTLQRTYFEVLLALRLADPDRRSTAMDRAR